MSISDIDAVPNGHSEAPEFYQNVVVMRHGDRFDNFERSWTATASRPWDPPLYKDGLVRAFDTGRTFLDLLGFPFHRVLVSPFLRCVQTAAQVIKALSDGADSNPSSPKVRQISRYTGNHHIKLCFIFVYRWLTFVSPQVMVLEIYEIVCGFWMFVWGTWWVISHLAFSDMA